MMSQSSGDKKHINMGYQIASGTSNQRAKFLGFTLQTYDFAPLTRWCRELQKGVFLRESDIQREKIYHKNIFLDLLYESNIRVLLRLYCFYASNIQYTQETKNTKVPF